MNQPAKAQEPSMEEILASIRRIISDDDAKPAAAPSEAAAPQPVAAKAADAKPASPKPAAVKPAATKAATAPQAAPVAASAPAPAAKNSQDDIDAMLASFDEPATATPQA